MTQPDEGSVPEQEASTSSAGDAPVEPVETPGEPETPKEPSLEEQLAERTADLQRLQAEYINYKRRVDRDRELVRAQGEATVLQSLLTVLDDLGRAAEHGELEGGFKAVADAIQQAVAKHRLEPFGTEGEPFDPSLHEAVFHAGESDDVDTTTIHSVMRTGYRHGDRVLRPATVGVVDPAPKDVEPVESMSDDVSSTSSGTDTDED